VFARGRDYVMDEAESGKVTREEFLHWIGLATAILLPLVVSQMILNDIIPCSYLELKDVTLKLTSKWQDCAFRLAAGVYEQLYKFGALATIEAVVAVLAVIGAGIVAFTRPAAGNSKLVMAVVLAGLLLALWRTDFNMISPHSCISASIIGKSLDGFPEDDETWHARCVKDEPLSSIQTFIGNTASSLKHAFQGVYRLSLMAGVVIVVAIGMIAAGLRTTLRLLPPTMPQADRAKTAEEQSANALRSTTYLIVLASALFATGMVMVQAYYDVGLSSLMSYSELVKPEDLATMSKPFLAYERIVQLHWGGTGSLVLAALFVVAIAEIAGSRVKEGLAPFPDYKKVWTLVVNLISIGAPMLVATFQTVAKGLE